MNLFCVSVYLLSSVRRSHSIQDHREQLSAPPEKSLGCEHGPHSGLGETKRSTVHRKMPPKSGHFRFLIRKKERKIPSKTEKNENLVAF